MPASSNDAIPRFRASERHLHWALAIPFMLSWTTAAVLVAVYNPHPERPYRLLFSWAHRASGLWLCVLPLWTVLVHRRDMRVYLQNIREAWCWTLDDLKWLALMGPAAVSSKITLPDQGKFNAAEKINFMSVMCTYPLYIVTGVLIWLPGVALLAWLVHFSLAVVTTPLVLGHIFMATINPETRVGLTGMITGLVPREWAKHHYRRWYVETFERGGTRQVRAAPAVATARAPAGPVARAAPADPAVRGTPSEPVVRATRAEPVARPTPVDPAARATPAGPALLATPPAPDGAVATGK